MLACFGGTPVRTAPYPGWVRVTDADRRRLLDTVRSGEWTNGIQRSTFEARFAADCGVKHCFAVANGTVSLELILRAMGIGYGDEVILPPWTFIATFSSIVFTGATPVFADIDADTYCLSVADTEAKITPRTKAIVAVAVAGRPVDFDAFEALSKKYGVRLIVDAAQAVGASWRGRRICTYGDAASVSCQNTKNLTAGEGGIITTNDDSLAERLSLLLGRTPQTSFASVVQDHNLSEFQSALLNSQYEKLCGEMDLRAENAAYLCGRLHGLDFVSPTAYDERVTRHAYHLFILRFHADVLAERGITRDQFLAAVGAEGIPLGAGYAPVYAFPCVSSDYTRRIIGTAIDTSPLPNTEAAAYAEGSWMYQSVLLGTHGDMDDIADALIKVWAHADDVRRL